MLSVAITGQKSFGRAALVSLLNRSDINIKAVFAPSREDLLWGLADQKGLNILESSSLSPSSVDGVDLLIAAHSHAFVGRRTRLRLKIGAIGYHPSLLPRHRGRDAVEWTIRMKDPIAGGSIYWLGDGVDNGPIAAQEHCFVLPGDTASDLWRRDLFPMGISLINRAITDISKGVLVMARQQEEAATWEPQITRARLFRPELEMIGDLPSGYSVLTKLNRGHCNGTSN